MTMLLEINDLHAWYGKSHVLQGIDLHVGRGEIVGVLGRNGAGRSTLVKAVMGQVQASGSIVFNGSQMLGLQSYQIARRGIGLVPENREIFPGLSVEQNLLLGEKACPHILKSDAPEPTQRWCQEDMYQLFPQLRERRNAPAGTLSGGEQQMLTLCRTLMGNPTLMMIDEPMEGLAPKIVTQVAEYFEVLKKRGVSILLIEQKLTVALSISQRIVVMGKGRIVFEGSTEAFDNALHIQKEWLHV
ncbi:MAG: ABC transporter ATP-binding protein [Pseudomonadota bacterium]